MDFYVCSTPYHLFISLCRITKEENESYIYLSTPDENVLKLFKSYSNELKKIDKVVDVKIRKRSNFKERLFLEYSKDVEEYKYIKKYVENSNMYIYPWHPYSLYSTSEYLFKKAKKVILVEDGASLYVKKEPSKMSNLIKKYIYKRNIEFYKEEKISKIVVQFPDRYPEHLKKKLSKLDLQSIFSEMEEETKETIIKVFDANIDLTIFNKPSIIILTQPLSEDGYISENEKIDLFKNIVETYRDGYNVIIKKHPRESTVYSIENTTEINGTFPSEIFTLMDIEFEKAIGVCTSAVNSIKAKEAFNTDEEFLKNN